ncbi:MAG: FtsX-like permease family protein, partial [Myxococcota bacterium]
MDKFSSARVLVLIGLRNLMSNKVKSSIVGSIMVFGTMLLVVGTALLDSVEYTMEKVVTSSLAGELQVYSSEGRDELSLFGGLTASLPDVGEIPDFSTMKRALERVPNVKAVVPMGITIATGSTGNDIDGVIGALRRALDDGDLGKADSLSDQIRQIAYLSAKEYEYRARISSDEEKVERDRSTLARVQTDAFWEELRADPAPNLLYLDTRLAPLASNGSLFFLRLLGTDPQLFKTSFERFKIDKGEMIPPKRRGLLISRRVHERFLKHRIARELDRIQREIAEEGRTIDDDELLQGRVRRMARQQRRILFQLDPSESSELEAMLREKFPEVQGDLEALVQHFLLMDSETFHERRAWFYEHIAPRIELYRINVGDVITIQSFTRRGYVKAVNLKVWGTFTFQGIEDSELAGVVNITDMLTFRELYGRMTQEQRRELEGIRDEVGVEDVDRDSVEEDLFGAQADLTAEVEDLERFDAFDDVTVINREERLERADELSYKQEEMERGLALNSAIVLEDPTKITQTRRALEQEIADQGMKLTVVDWQQASGLVGQMIIVIRIVLYIAIFIIFLVALVIINNSMVMATMDRVSEIGTMRAIGAQRRFILWMFLFETFVLGVLSGALGALLGVVAVEIMQSVGLPATNEILRFIFAGPRLHPT